MTIYVYTKTTLQKLMTRLPVKSKIWSLWCPLFTMMKDALNRFHLMLCDVINYNDVISTADSLESVKCTFY